MSAGILLYTYIYTTVIARSVATWQSSSVTSPRSRVYFYIPAYTPPSLRGAQRRGNHPLSLPRVRGYTFIYPHIHHRHCEERSDVAIILCHFPAFAGILLYTRIYTAVIARSAATWQSPPVIARSAATWQSSSVTSPRSQVYFYIPQNTISHHPS